MRILLFLVYALALASACSYAYKDSYYDFDILMYSACVLQTDTTGAQTLHSATYALAKKELPPDKWARLTDTNNQYRHQLHLSPEKFVKQLSFYKVKPLYVWVLKAGYHLGFSPFRFSSYLNLMSYLVIGFLLMVYLIRHLSFNIAYCSAFCIMLMPMVLDTAKNNCPDMFAAALFLSASLCLMSINISTRYWSILFFILLILIRAETLLFVLVFLTINYFSRTSEYKPRFLTILLFASMVTFLFVAIVLNKNSWALLYRHTFLGYISDIDSAPQSLTVREYLLGFKSFIRGLFFSDFSLLVLMLLLIYNFRSQQSSILKTMTITSILYIVVRLLLFPDVSIRFYTGLFVLVFILFLRYFFGKQGLIKAI